MKTSRQNAVIAACAAAVVVAVPFFTRNDFLLNLTILIMVWSIFAVGFDLVFGLLGMVSFGHAARADGLPPSWPGALLEPWVVASLLLPVIFGRAGGRK